VLVVLGVEVAVVGVTMTVVLAIQFLIANVHPHFEQ
jgi:hypothetical protein